MTILFTLISLKRRSRLARLSYDLALPNIKLTWIIPALLLVAAILIVSGIQEEKPTEFYLLDKDGMLSQPFIPEDSKTCEVVVVVSSYCNEANYTVEMKMDETPLEKHEFVLHGEEKWTRKVKFDVPDQESVLRFALYRDQVPIRRLHLLMQNG